MPFGQAYWFGKGAELLVKKVAMACGSSSAQAKEAGATVGVIVGLVTAIATGDVAGGAATGIDKMTGGGS